MNKDRILIVGNYNRQDFLLPFAQIKDTVDLFFIEFSSKRDITNHAYLDYGKAIFWKDFSSGYELLTEINPKKIFFYFIETYNHVALNVASQSLGIKTFHIEHGIRNYESVSGLSEESRKDNSGHLHKFNIFRIYEKMKTRLFFTNTIKKSNTTDGKNLNKYFKIRSQNSIFQTFSIEKSSYRIPNHYISFSPEAVKFHVISDHLPDQHPISYTGIPIFDKYHSIKTSNELKDNIIFIDQCFPEQQIRGWNQEHRYKLIEQIERLILKPKKLKLFVKIHPISDIKIWNKLAEKFENIVLLVGDDDFMKKLSENRIILGFTSTLLLPLMVQKHTICFSLENHPNNQKISGFLTESKVIDPIFSIKELAECIDNVDRISTEQSKFKKDFEYKWLYKFDGKSQERLNTILLS